MGKLYSSWNNHDTAILCFQKSLELNKDDLETMNSLGIAYLKAKKFEQAKKCFQKVIRLQPDNIIAYGNIGNVFAEE